MQEEIKLSVCVCFPIQTSSKQCISFLANDASLCVSAILTLSQYACAAHTEVCVVLSFSLRQVTQTKQTLRVKFDTRKG